MLKIGLTGNIGSGKTTVARIFRALGIPVFEADAYSKTLLADPEILERISIRFGDGIRSADGSADRSALASVVFGDPKALHDLNAILHPGVMKGFALWMDSNPSAPYVILEAAILIESGYRETVDQVVHVSCPKEIAVSRVVQRDHTDGDSVLRRLQHQMEESVKAALADFVVNNDGSRLLIPQVLELHRLFSERGS